MWLLTVHLVFTVRVIWRLYFPLPTSPHCFGTCLPKLYTFCLTDTRTGGPGSHRLCLGPASNGTRSSQSVLPSALDQDVQWYRSNSFAASTAKTYSAQLTSYLSFCDQLLIKPVPISQTDLGRYIAFLSRRLSFSSVRQYLNVVRLLHLDAGLKNPLENNWYVTSILKGVRRVKGDKPSQKFPITLEILRDIFLHLNLYDALDRCFWAACLVGFFSFFRKSNLLIKSHILFDPSRHLCAGDVQFTPEGAILKVRWSKVIQFRERTLYIPLPKIPNSPFCPSAALLMVTLGNQPCPRPVPLFRYHFGGADNVPLTHSQFTQKLHASLSACGIQAAKYSGHSFRRGGATFALQCGLPINLIKLQGDWSSNACERYLEPSLQLRKQVANTMGSSAAQFCTNSSVAGQGR